VATNPSLELIGPIPKRPGDHVYSEWIADEICERIAAGETLTGICLGDDMPPIRTVSKWLMRHPEFGAKYAHAREAQMHLEAEQIREIADNAYEDYYIDYKQDADGNMVPFVVVNGDSIKRAQLRIGARQWRAERLNRRVYGNSTRHEHAMAEPEQPALKPGCLPGSLSFLDRSGESEPG
jgi:hypothetical protein